MPRRHPILLTLFVLFLTGAAALALFIATFDLDRYRSQLQESLSAALARPVALGQAGLSISHGPAFDFSEIRIGSAKDQKGTLNASRLRVKLELSSLLNGRIAFSEIHIEAPTISLHLDPPQASATTSDAGSGEPFLQQLQRIQISDLSIDDGTLILIDSRHPGAPYRHTVSDIKARIQGLAPLQELHLSASAHMEQKEQGSPLNLQASLLPAGNSSDLKRARIDLDMSMENLLPSPLLRHYAPAHLNLDASGRLSLALKVKGDIATGVQISAEGRGQAFSILSPTLYSRPCPVESLRFAGIWQETDNLKSLDNLLVHLDDKEITGNLELKTRENTPWVDASFTSNQIALKDLLQAIPDVPAPAITEIRKAVPDGTVRLESLSFSGPAKTLRRPDEALARTQGCLSLQNAAWQHIRFGDVKNIQGQLCLLDNHLEIKNGSLQALGAPISANGQLSAPFNSTARGALRLEGSLPSGQLLTQLLPAPPEGLTVAGPAPAILSLDGPLQDLKINLQADLEEVSVHFANHFHKPGGQKGRLFLSAGLTPERLAISKGQLQAGPIDLNATGNLSFDKGRAFSAELQLINFDLASGRPMLPLLERLDARGQVSLAHSLHGSDTKILDHQGELLLDKVGAHLTRVIADVNDVTGTVRLSNNEIKATGLFLKLGNSPLSVDATIADFTKPELDLRVKGPSIRADELIFRSDTAYLRDVDGHLRINPRGIFFDPVLVRLDGGTDARVTGSVTNFKAPHTALDIEADFGNIDEVIALWSRPQSAPSKPQRAKAEKKAKATLFIAVNAHRGKLWNLNFTDAKGDITLRDGVLTILPLRFSSGAGFCQGQVAVDNTQGSPALLKISGHLENFDAYTIYTELLKRQGLVSGTLAGDFYLEGNAGSSFLDTSRGAFSFSVSDGVLRKFPFMSKVFSVLNVSQLLTLKLPDMDSQGMPFSLLNANAALHQGTLSTKDLFIDSKAMNLSLIGDLSLKEKTLDMTLGVKPLGTVDQIITHIPVAGWILAGEEKALITAHFQIEGKTGSPTVTPIPITSISEKVLGIFRRVLELPAKVIADTGEALKH